MKNNNRLTRGLAITGTVLVWLPVLAPFVFGIGALLRDGIFRFDYLMPAEVFPVALLGCALLLWASLRAHARRGLIGWGFGGALVLLFGAQFLAEATGMASGALEPPAWLMAIVMGGIIGYALALVVVGVGGSLLSRDLFRQGDSPTLTSLN